VPTSTPAKGETGWNERIKKSAAGSFEMSFGIAVHPESFGPGFEFKHPTFFSSELDDWFAVDAGWAFVIRFMPNVRLIAYSSKPRRRNQWRRILSFLLASTIASRTLPLPEYHRDRSSAVL
jgi:hypothetical protein